MNKQHLSHLQQAQALVLPTREATLARSYSTNQFWHENKQLLENAWVEWENSSDITLPQLDESLIAKPLSQAIKAAWNNPEEEHKVSDLWQEVAPGVYQSQFLDPQYIPQLREYMDEAAKADIPLRAPYGIALNRGGAMLDPRSEGYLAAPEFQRFYQLIMQKYMRPSARMLFPEIMGFDTQTFGFSIKYQTGVDTSLRLHTDASAVTMNLNFNLVGETFEGSEVDFYDRDSGSIHRIKFAPGTAMLHRGNIAHAAQPILQGERFNMVFWLYGDRGQIPTLGSEIVGLTAAQRWTIPDAMPDTVAPF